MRSASWSTSSTPVPPDRRSGATTATGRCTTASTGSPRSYSWEAEAVDGDGRGVARARAARAAAREHRAPRRRPPRRCSACRDDGREPPGLGGARPRRPRGLGRLAGGEARRHRGARRSPGPRAAADGTDPHPGRPVDGGPQRAPAAGPGPRGCQDGPSWPRPIRGRERPRPRDFWVFAAVLAVLFVGAGAPTPLYVVYERQYGFSAIVLTLVFAVYVVALLGAFVVAGRLSDHIGRRPVLLIALPVNILAAAAFLVADATGWLLVARAIQGVSVGLATAALSASLLDTEPAGPPRARRGGLELRAAGRAGRRRARLGRARAGRRPHPSAWCSGCCSPRSSRRWSRSRSRRSRHPPTGAGARRCARTSACRGRSARRSPRSRRA